MGCPFIKSGCYVWDSGLDSVAAFVPASRLSLRGRCHLILNIMLIFLQCSTDFWLLVVLGILGIIGLRFAVIALSC